MCRVAWKDVKNLHRSPGRYTHTSSSGEEEADKDERGRRGARKEYKAIRYTSCGKWNCEIVFAAASSGHEVHS